MTYSIVARDPQTGAMGVAVQSCVYGVGATVPWARAGVGVVATQSFAEMAYGPRCLDALAEGASPQEALDAVRAADPGSAMRQVAVLGADGRTAAFTGEGCIDHAGELAGEGFSAQANMMAGPTVWPAMADAFRASTGPLERRLLTVLLAAQEAGGDARGRMSAAVLVVAAEPAEPWGGRLAEARVDYSDDPLADLAHTLDGADAARLFDRTVNTLMTGDAPAALALADQGLALAPQDGNLVFIRSGALLMLGQVSDARQALQELLGRVPTWEIIIRGFAAAGLMPLPPDVSLDDLLSVSA